MSDTKVTLTQRQYDVLISVYRAERDKERPVYEVEVYFAARQHDLVKEGATLYGHLRNLMDCGMVERHGSRGGYSYSLTTAGRTELTW